MKSPGLLIAAATLTLASAAHADTCSQHNVTSTVTLVFDEQRVLNALPAAKDGETNLPTASLKAVALMKARLGDYIVATMRCMPGKIDAAGLRSRLQRFADVWPLPEGTVVRNPSPPAHNFGEFPDFEVRDLWSDTVGVVARFGIHCGEDAMLMIFERRNAVWTETLRSQGAPYKEVSGGWWEFDYGAARDKGGHWFVVTKNVAPWCSSTWSEIRYQVLRPGADAAHPRVLFSKSDSIWWGPDTFGDLKVDSSGFDLRWPAESMDSDIHNREWIARYDVDGDRVVRAPPIAESPRDFADEWVRLDWKEAKDWTARAYLGLQPLHDQLRKQHYFTYQSVRRCSDGDHTQIEVEPVEGGQRHVFFQVSGKKVFVMGDVGFKPDSHCTGPNLFDINKPQ